MNKFRLIKHAGSYTKRQEFEWDSVRTCKLKVSGATVVRHTLKIEKEHRGIWIPDLGCIIGPDIGRTLVIDGYPDKDYPGRTFYHAVITD